MNDINVGPREVRAAELSVIYFWDYCQAQPNSSFSCAELALFSL